MRAVGTLAFGLIFGLALVVAPAAAQAKTKDAGIPLAPADDVIVPTDEAAVPAIAKGEAVSVQVFKTCLDYARGDILAGESAMQQGWEAYDDGGESPFVRAYSGSKTFPDIGYAALFSLVESYPGTTFGYCRIDIQAPSGEARVKALNDLPILAKGQLIVNAEGTFGSWKGVAAEPQLLLLSHQTADAYVLQMTLVTHQPNATPNTGNPPVH